MKTTLKNILQSAAIGVGLATTIAQPAYAANCVDRAWPQTEKIIDQTWKETEKLIGEAWKNVDEGRSTVKKYNRIREDTIKRYNKIREEVLSEFQRVRDSFYNSENCEEFNFNGRIQREKPKQELVQPEPPLDELLSVDKLKKKLNEKTTKQFTLEQRQAVVSIEDYIQSKIKELYLLPLHDLEEGNKEFSCQAMSMSHVDRSFKNSNSPDVDALVKCIYRGENDAPREVKYYATYTSDTTEEILGYDARVDNEKAAFKMVKTPTSKTLCISIPDLINALSEKDAFEQYVSEGSEQCADLAIEQKDGKITTTVPGEKGLKEEFVNPLSQIQSLEKFFVLLDLAKERYGFQKWINEHADVINKARQDGREELKKEEELSQLLQTFAKTITKEESYSSLVKKSEFQPLFKEHPLLVDPFFQASKIKTSINSPEKIEGILNEVKKSVQFLPQGYQNVFKKINLYLALSANDVKALCNWEGSHACYNNATDTMYIQEGSQPTLAHELAHTLTDQLPAKQRKEFVSTLEQVMKNQHFERDLIRNSEKLVDSWQDHTKGERYAVPRAYGASNVDEYIATYVEDIFSNNGANTISILKTPYRDECVKTLNTLKKNGFLGEAKDAEQLLQGMYQKAGLGKSAVNNMR